MDGINKEYIKYNYILETYLTTKKKLTKYKQDKNTSSVLNKHLLIAGSDLPLAKLWNISITAQILQGNKKKGPLRSQYSL